MNGFSLLSTNWLYFNNSCANFYYNRIDTECMYILGKTSLHGIEIFTEEIVKKCIHKNKLSLLISIYNNTYII